MTEACGLFARPSLCYKYSIVFWLLKFCCALEARLHYTNSENFLQGNALPLTDRCLHVTVGSGLPIARHSRVTLLPSFTVTSEEMFMIWGGTGKRQRRRDMYEKDSLQKRRHQPHMYSNSMDIILNHNFSLFQFLMLDSSRNVTINTTCTGHSWKQFYVRSGHSRRQVCVCEGGVLSKQ